MRAVRAEGAGGPEVLRLVTVPTPTPKSGEVLVQVKAAGINRADILQREGKYPPPEGASDILGLEASGIIVAVGQGVTAQLGDEVCVLLDSGACAEYVAAPADLCLPKPGHLSWAAAAALPEAVFTTYANIFEHGRLQAGETVLIHGGASGIGTIAIPLSKRAGGIVIATAGSEEKCRICLDRGADLAINYRSQDFVEIMKQQKRQADIVLDMVGGDYVPRNLAVMAYGGRHVSIAIQRGRIAEIDVWRVMTKQLVLTGSTLRHRSVQEKARLAAAVRQTIWPWVEKNQINPLIYNEYSIENVVTAHKEMDFPVHHGKTVLTVA